MRSTFMGLETSKRGIFTQQSALYTTGHNIANANTVGYSRQRVNMEPTLGYPGMGLNAPKTAGFIGTGVKAGSVQRIRDEFIDRQYRQETNKLGYWDSKAKAIAQMEDIMSEPSEYGLDEAFRMFWSALQDVSTNPEDTAARKVAIQRAVHLADSFNYIETQLKQIQGNLGNEIKVSVADINSILEQIADINRQIQAVEPNGYVPNDLYDQRDLLVDKLNEYLPVSIERIPSGGNASKVAEGSLKITLNTGKKDASGKPIEIVLVDGRNAATLKAIDTNGTEVDGVVDNIGTSDTYYLFQHLEIVEANGNVTTVQKGEFEEFKGKLVSLIDSYGYETEKGYYPEMLSNLKKLADAFIEVFNTVHEAGYTLGTDDQPSTTGITFFERDATGQVKVRDEIINNPNLLAASDVVDEEGNGKWALILANLQSMPMANGAEVGTEAIQVTLTLSPDIDLDGATFQSFYQGLVGQLGVDGQKANLLKTNSETIRLTVENNRASMSSVSLDEEMTDMIRFQQAYNASARMITVIDETLDKIINGMGRVGL
ncbi:MULTISPECIES: flagellar hook-associated protein FlgK [Ureibacillus]|jgi:flagellar hook-associated protein 1 FlgK|uniref:Flagellar hook-associated protein 1 n=1 Tax=Ureibacillus thermosphaericus TaxID=51173 RepID=A0A840PTB6_URETH|nr:flagellar hook-associated protein FlgK [Ureibacillus thermosphaericus]MBB5149719.1 flagellar hook-associated protein 1 FlgK [Ureibacillus thermosphaericus]NKZ32647.1 flagellar hook-associated protein FlgK [Ureibacillus thermosphaericus]